MKKPPSTHNDLLPDGIKGVPMPESPDEALLLWFKLEVQCGMSPADVHPRRTAHSLNRTETVMPTTQTIAQRNTDTGAVLDQIDPDRIRVVDVENERTGNVIRRDCYDPGTEVRMFRLRDGHVQLRTLQWDQSDSLNPTVEITWEDTGLKKEDVDQIRIFEWPAGDLVRVFKDME